MKKIIALVIMLQIVLSLTAIEYIGSPLVSETCTASAIQGNTLYMVTDWGLMIYSVADENNPVLVNKFPLNKGRGGIFTTISDGKLVVSGKTTSIYDISIPEQPAEIYNLELPYVTDCTITDDFILVNLCAYETNGYYSFSVFDKTTLPELNEIANFENTVSHELEDNDLYLIDFIESYEPDSLVTIKKYELETNGNITIIDSINIYSQFNNLRDFPYMEINNEVIFVKTEGYIHSISLSTFDLLCSASFNNEYGDANATKNFRISDNHLYGDGGVYWDISEPDDIEYLGLWSEDFSNPFYLQFINKFCCTNSNLFIPNWENGFIIFDISNPLNIEIANWHNTWNTYKGLAIKNNYLYVTSWYSLDVIDISDPTNPIQISSTQSLSYLSEIIIEGNYAYVGAESGLMTYDISDPVSPNLISNTQMHTIDYDLEKHHNYIYGIGMDFSGEWLTITDVSDVTNPVIELQLHDNDTLNNIWDLTINQDLMYIADANWNTNWTSYSGGLRIYDIVNPIVPTYIAVCNPDTTTQYNSITLKDNVAYLSGVSTNNDGYVYPETFVINISEPTDPVLIQTYEDPIRVQKAVINGDYRYTGGWLYSDWNGEAIYDISTSENPILVDYIEDHSGVCYDIIVKNGYIYSAKGQCINVYYTDYYNASIDNNTVPTVNKPELSQNYPNPFNPTTTIQFSIPTNSDTELTIYNIKGQKIKTLLSDSLTKGAHSCIWNGQDSNGKVCSSGLYLYKLSTEQTSVTKRMILIK